MLLAVHYRVMEHLGINLPFGGTCTIELWSTWESICPLVERKKSKSYHPI